MKKQMFALLALVSTFVGSGLQADCCDYGCDGNFYIGGYAGVNFLQNVEKHDVTMKFKTGFAGGAAIGYEFQNHIRAEAEFAYRRNTLKSIEVGDEEIDTNHINLNVQSYAALANLLYDFDLCSDWVPYVGFGVGYSWNKFSNHHHDILGHKDKNDGFAFQGIVGVGYSFKNCGGCFGNSVLGLEYRYFQTKNHIKDHSIVASLRYGF